MERTTGLHVVGEMLVWDTWCMPWTKTWPTTSTTKSLLCSCVTLSDWSPLSIPGSQLWLFSLLSHLIIKLSQSLKGTLCSLYYCSVCIMHSQRGGQLSLHISFCCLSYYRSVTSSKASSSPSAVFQFLVSSLFLKFIQLLHISSSTSSYCFYPLLYLFLNNVL